MNSIDEIIATVRRDSRCVSGSEIRKLCDEIERLRESENELTKLWQSSAKSAKHWMMAYNDSKGKVRWP